VDIIYKFYWIFIHFISLISWMGLHGLIFGY
jgi:hypothetical protein